MNTIIFEGCRGTGKTTISRMLRNKIPESTLINPTGFNVDGEEGYYKSMDYYDSLLSFVSFMKDHESTVIWDRFFFSEVVYSRLYKSYDVSHHLDWLMNHLIDSSDKLTIFYLRNEDQKSIEQRLKRDKVEFNDIKDDAKESLKQQDAYDRLFSSLASDFGESKLEIIIIDTANKNEDEIYDVVSSCLEVKQDA